MMKYSKYLVVLLFLSGCMPNRSLPQNGTQTISIMVGSTKIVPDQVLLYYGNYLIEQTISIKLTSANNSSPHRSFDSSYYLINFGNDSCVEYKRFQIDCPAGKIFKLSDKKLGVHINTFVDTSMDYSPHLPLRDTMVNGSAYKYFTIHSKRGTADAITCYLLYDKHPLYHLNDKIDADYGGTVVRMDMAKAGEEDPASVQMAITPDNLTVDQIKIIKSWIRSNNWKE